MLIDYFSLEMEATVRHSVQFFDVSSNFCRQSLPVEYPFLRTNGVIHIQRNAQVLTSNLALKSSRLLYSVNVVVAVVMVPSDDIRSFPSTIPSVCICFRRCR
mmetsp:Transcript_6508/g.12570  ORF Transcript_6508/g.12570 Transcript_6508/m.12570 type:complete len:102 (+) Transcript_6508:45-350(+)